MKTDVAEHQSRMPRVCERNVPEFEAFANRSRYRQGIRLRRYRRFHREEVQQIGDEERLVRDGREGGKNRLYVGARSGDLSRQKIKGANRERSDNSFIKHKVITAVKS